MYAGYFAPNGVDPTGMMTECAENNEVDEVLQAGIDDFAGMTVDMVDAYGPQSTAYDAAALAYLSSGHSEEESAYFAEQAERASDSGLGLPSMFPSVYLDPMVQLRLRREAFYGGLQDIMMDSANDMYMAMAMNIGAGGFTIASRMVSTSSFGIRMGAIAGRIGQTASRFGGGAVRVIRSAAVAGITKARTAIGRISQLRSRGRIPQMVSPTVAELRVIGAGVRGLQAHHILPQYLGKMLGFTEQQMLSHPGTLITQWSHTGAANLDAMHKAIAAFLPPMANGARATYTAAQIRTGLLRAYQRIGRQDLFDAISHLIP